MQKIDYARARSLMSDAERRAEARLRSPNHPGTEEEADDLCLRVLGRAEAVARVRGGAGRTLEQLLAIEAEGGIPSDMRRIISEERQMLQSAIQAGDAESIARRRKQAIETAGLWGREVS